jgi:hypothetical protein
MWRLYCGRCVQVKFLSDGPEDTSIAFGIPTGAVDGNVCRVFCRLFLISADLTKREGKALIWYESDLNILMSGNLRMDWSTLKVLGILTKL